MIESRNEIIALLKTVPSDAQVLRCSKVNAVWLLWRHFSVRRSRSHLFLDCDRRQRFLSLRLDFRVRHERALSQHLVKRTALQVLLGVVHLQELTISSLDVAEVERRGRRRDIATLDRVLFDRSGRCHNAWTILVVDAHIAVLGCSSLPMLLRHSGGSRVRRSQRIQGNTIVERLIHG